MGRPKGSEASKDCQSCGRRVIFNRNEGILYNYDRHSGRKGRHTCNNYYNGQTRTTPIFPEDKSHHGDPQHDGGGHGEGQLNGISEGEQGQGEGEGEQQGEGQGEGEQQGDGEGAEGAEGDAEGDAQGQGGQGEGEGEQDSDQQGDGNGMTPPTGKIMTDLGPDSRTPDELSAEAVAKTLGLLGELGVATTAEVTEQITKAVEGLAPREHKIEVKLNDIIKFQGEGRPHKEMETVLKQLAIRHHVWMTGPAGGGKTTVAEQAAKSLGLPYQEISCGPATDQWDLFGHNTPDGRYLPGKIREVFEGGGVLMLDEIDNTNAEVLVAMNSALANGHATFPDGRVTKHPDFVCIAGANTFGRGADRMYVGRNQIDAATLDRFGFMVFDYDEEAEFEWVAARAAGFDNWVKYVQAVRKAATERQLRVIVSPRASIFGAEKLASGMFTWEETADLQIWNKMDSEDKMMLQTVVPIAEYQN